MARDTEQPRPKRRTGLQPRLTFERASKRFARAVLDVGLAGSCAKHVRDHGPHDWPVRSEHIVV